MYHPVLWAAFGTGITCLSTVLGSATVLFVRGKTTPTLQRMFLGFAAGVMVAASVFSPVSYTHLDVYKRQMFSRPWTLTCSPFLIPSTSGFPSSPGKNLLTRIEPV